MFKVISLHGAVFNYFTLYPSNIQLFFAFERPESLAILPGLPEPTYLSLPIFPLVLHRRESFLVRLVNTKWFYLFFSGDSLRFKFRQQVD